MATTDHFDRQDLKDLLKAQDAPSVSIYMPTHRMGRDTQGDPIRLKNLLRDAEDRLAAQVRRTLAIDLLAQARKLVDDERFWLHQSDGLALFASDQGMRAWRLPIPFAETCVVADAFHLKPLLPLFSGDGVFYILALSENEVRLLQGTRQSVSEIVLPDMPTALSELIEDDGEGASLSYHTGAGRGTSAGRAAVFHGHGGMDKSTEKDLRLKFFRQVDKGLRDLFRDQPAPLVLAGVEAHFALYRQANAFPMLMEQGVSGSPDRTTPEELHSMAWSIVEPHFRREEDETRRNYAELAGTGKTTSDVVEAMRAAVEGRIDRAFVAVGVQVWGAWDEAARTAIVHERQETRDADLLNEIAMRAIAAGGLVFAVSPDSVPGGGLVAAILRF